MFAFRAIACAMPDEPHRNPVPDVDQVADQFKVVGVPGLAICFQLAHDRLPTHVRPRLWPILRGPPDDARVVQLAEGIHVPLFPHLKAAAHDLHVLLRHRPRSISRKPLLSMQSRTAASRPKRYFSTAPAARGFEGRGRAFCRASS